MEESVVYPVFICEDKPKLDCMSSWCTCDIRTGEP